MKYCKQLLIVVFVLTTTLFAQPQATKFAPGIVSTSDVFATTFTPDGNTVYFCQSSRDRKDVKILQSQFRNGEWSKPALAPFSAHPFKEIDPFITPDGKRLIYNSLRPVGNADTTLFNIWYVEREGKGWGKPKLYPKPVTNDTTGETFATTALNGDIYYSIDHKTDTTIRGVVRSRFIKGRYQKPEYIWFSGFRSFGNAFIASDVSYLIFSGQKIGESQNDLYITINKAGAWLEPQNLGALVNTELNEFAPYVDAKRGKLYFSRMKRGTTTIVEHEDIYSIDLAAFNIPELLSIRR